MSEVITSEDLEEHERMIEKQSNAFANFGKEYWPYNIWYNKKKEEGLKWMVIIIF